MASSWDSGVLGGNGVFVFTSESLGEHIIPGRNKLHCQEYTTPSTLYFFRFCVPDLCLQEVSLSFKDLQTKFVVYIPNSIHADCR